MRPGPRPPSSSPTLADQLGWTTSHQPAPPHRAEPTSAQVTEGPLPQSQSSTAPCLPPNQGFCNVRQQPPRATIEPLLSRSHVLSNMTMTKAVSTIHRAVTQPSTSAHQDPPYPYPVTPILTPPTDTIHS
ncbi:hypothetical protein FA13DRAFT_1795406 [Coprinellus micaceus]|uniref:Uncharacterized protein n=1 Tax=Coprinellus micaceus TaxID=71717 RepID=A0A4Y7SXY0_COPMI|nr:hypothetical protein FA13DRAFT_1795406 [Coprinellus micaceus]